MDAGVTRREEAFRTSLSGALPSEYLGFGDHNKTLGADSRVSEPLFFSDNASNGLDSPRNSSSSLFVATKPFEPSWTSNHDAAWKVFEQSSLNEKQPLTSPFRAFCPPKPALGFAANYRHVQVPSDFRLRPPVSLKPESRYPPPSPRPDLTFSPSNGFKVRPAPNSAFHPTTASAEHDYTARSPTAPERGEEATTRTDEKQEGSKDDSRDADESNVGGKEAESQRCTELVQYQQPSLNAEMLKGVKPLNFFTRSGDTDYVAYFMYCFFNNVEVFPTEFRSLQRIYNQWKRLLMLMLGPSQNSARLTPLRGAEPSIPEPPPPSRPPRKKRKSSVAPKRQGNRQRSGQARSEESVKEELCFVCHSYNLEDFHLFDWIQCDRCSRWGHIRCARQVATLPRKVRGKYKGEFYCNECE